MTEATQMLVDAETARQRNQWLTTRVTLEGTNVRYWPTNGGSSLVLPRAEASPVVEIVTTAQSGYVVEQPTWWSWFLLYGDAYAAQQRMRQASSHAVEAAEQRLRNDLRDALLEAWEGHRSHISREDLNQFLEANDMEPAAQILSGTVKLYFEPIEVQVENVEVEDGEDADEAMIEAAKEQVHHSDLSVDTDASEVEYDE